MSKSKKQPDIDLTESEASGKHSGLDLISRQSAIDIVNFECGEWTGLAKTIAGEIKQLPSAEPEIIYCKDCKYWWKEHELCKRNKDQNHNCACMKCKSDFYCANAEKENQ